jgi:penicillin-binding protein 1B
VWYQSSAFKVLLAVFIFSLIAASGVTLYYYNYYSRIIDRRLEGEIFKRTARIYATPYRIYPGQRLRSDAVIARLQRAGFETPDKADLAEGTYELDGNRLTIHPKVGDALRLDFGRNSLVRIVKLPRTETAEAWLPAEFVTNLFDESRQKRRVVEFEQLPKLLVDALIAAEDQRFFSHWGLDPIRIVGAVVASIRNSDRVEGVSTLTQQLARNFFLTPDRAISRKVAEAFIALMLEQRLTKEQILTLYANEVYLGQRGSFSIQGFGEGAAAYFGKDLDQLTLPEAATLVGLFPAPNLYNPTKYPDRATNRRNLVLGRMLATGAITQEEHDEAKASELEVAPIKVDATDAPYLVDFIRQELLKDYSEDELINNSLNVYTTLDPDLQKAAVDAVDKGLQFVRQQMAARDRGKRNPETRIPQAAIIALDPRTGEIKAMVGGGDYGSSQYNRITEAFRQPGSIFKPFVYAAAFETAFDSEVPAQGESGAASVEPTQGPGGEAVPPAVDTDAPSVFPDPEIRPMYREGYITPLTTFVDEFTTFVYEGERIYEPNN